MSGEVLFLAHRMPFPPDRGDKIRSCHLLRHLAGLGPVHVATFAEIAADQAHEAELAAVSASHCLIRRSKPLPLAGVEALLRRQPVSLSAFHSPKLADYVERLLRERPIAAIYVFSGQMGQYVPAWFRGRVIMDFVDVDSAKFDAYGQGGSGPRAWIDAREGRLLRAEEARLARRADCSLFVSQEEADLFAGRLFPVDRASCDVRALRNGIDSGTFDRRTVAAEPAMAALPAPRLIFTGQMDYAPNIAAAERAIERILPLVREAFPDASFHVVGRNPPEQLLARHGQNGAFVWGGVEDIREWLAAADLALVPLELARGIQNKVLEAMSMGLPVVLTPAAATGIGGIDAHHYAVADSDLALAERAIALLSDHDHGWAMGLEARRFVVEGMSWQATLAPLAAMLGLGEAAARHAA